eukprot:354941-Chlamydomonas_euryale.AAC.5
MVMWPESVPWCGSAAAAAVDADAPGTVPEAVVEAGDEHGLPTEYTTVTVTTEVEASDVVSKLCAEGGRGEAIINLYIHVLIYIGGGEGWRLWTVVLCGTVEASDVVSKLCVWEGGAVDRRAAWYCE